MLGSDEDSNDDNEDIDHIPKTPGPPAISSDRESEDEKSGDEKEDEVKNNENDSDSDSNSSSSQSDSSNDNNRNSRNDSEVERSDNENDNEEMDDNRETAKASDNEDKNEVSSDDNDDNEEQKGGNESQEKDSDSDDEDVVRKVSPKKKRQLEDNSDSSDEEIPNKKQRTESNENEDNDDNEDNEDNEDKDEEMVDKTAKAKDIFGDLSSEEEDEEENKQKDTQKDSDKDSDKESDNDNRSNQRRDDESGDEDRVRREGDTEQPFVEDEEPVEEPIPETRIEVEIPRIVADLGSEVHFVKLPNFLSIDTHPYDPQWYEDEIDEDENLDDEGRARLKLKVENTIRWRNVLDKKTNELKKESNTRVVKWSDGTFSLHLGEEIFDIHKLQLMTGDNNHLFIRQGTGLQGQTVFRTKLNFRPFSTESFTHRKLTLSLADRSQKTQKIRVLPNVGKDPEAHRTEMIKKEEDRLKASIRRENKQRRVRERSLVRGPTASYLEPDGDDDDEEEGISLAKIKNQFKRGSFNKTYDEPDESADESNAKPADDDDSEDDLFDKKKTEKRRPVQLVESDDD